MTDVSTPATPAKTTAEDNYSGFVLWASFGFIAAFSGLLGLALVLIAFVRLCLVLVGLALGLLLFGLPLALFLGTALLLFLLAASLGPVTALLAAAAFLLLLRGSLCLFLTLVLVIAPGIVSSSTLLRLLSRGLFVFVRV